MSGSVGSEGWLAQRLRTGPPLLLDGALGTELERAGIRSDLPLWSSHALLEAPQAVLAIHRAYAEAGAEILTADTFRTQRRCLERGGLGRRAAGLCAQAVALAREARRGVAHPVAVLGSAPPLEDCYRPDLVPDAAALAEEHAEHAAHLVAAGVDGILVETMNSTREALAALRAAREAGAEALVSFVADAQARLPSGERLARAAAAVAEAGALAVGVNCLPPAAVAPCLAVLCRLELPFGVYPNLGAPLPDGNFAWRDDVPPSVFADRAREWSDAGARFVGGCCGTTPEYVAAMASRRG